MQSLSGLVRRADSCIKPQGANRTPSAPLSAAAPHPQEGFPEARPVSFSQEGFPKGGPQPAPLCRFKGVRGEIEIPPRFSLGGRGDILFSKENIPLASPYRTGTVPPGIPAPCGSITSHWLSVQRPGVAVRYLYVNKAADQTLVTLQPHQPVALSAGGKGEVLIVTLAVHQHPDGLAHIGGVEPGRVGVLDLQQLVEPLLLFGTSGGVRHGCRLCAGTGSR